MLFKKIPKNEHDVKIEALTIINEELIRLNIILSDILDSGFYKYKDPIISELLLQRRRLQEQLFKHLSGQEDKK